jgi:hypothetical protein
MSMITSLLRHFYTFATDLAHVFMSRAGVTDIAFRVYSVATGKTFDFYGSGKLKIHGLGEGYRAPKYGLNADGATNDFKAGENIPGNYIVMVGADQTHVLKCTDVTKAIGTNSSSSQVNSGGLFEILFAGTLPIQLDSAVGGCAVGDYIGLSGTAGMGTKVTSGQYLGIASKAAAADGVALVIWRPGYLPAA